MSDTAWQEEVGRRVVALQIIVGAFLVGSIGFLAVAAALVHQRVVEPDRKLAWVFNLVLVLSVIGGLIARLTFPRVRVTQGRRMIAAGQWSLPEGMREGEIAAFIARTGDAGRLFFLYQITTVIAFALLDGTALFAIIVYLITQSTLGLVVAVALIIGVAFHIPTRSGVVHWVEDQLELVEQERQLRPN